MDYKGELKVEPEMFDKGIVFETRGMQASLFRYGSGVAAVKIKNDSRGEMILTPLQGMQIWCAEFDGKSLGMDSKVKEPVLGKEYLPGYGALLVHCGARRMGCPSETETPFPIHGDLPYADYSGVVLHFGEELGVPYMTVTANLSDPAARMLGSFYNAFPAVKLTSGSSIIDVSMKIANIGPADMDLMYLAHINLLGVPGSELVYSAPCTPEDVLVRTGDPAQSKDLTPEFLAFRQSIVDNPSIQDRYPEDFPFNPEVVSYFKFLADEEGWAHSMAVLPDGNAFYVAHNPQQFPIGVRWMRTVENPPDSFPVRRSLGYLPSTSHVEGYENAKARGSVRTLKARQNAIFNYKIGLLTKDETAEMRGTIEDILINQIK